MRPVTNDEVVACASKKCKRCYGVGRLYGWRYVDAETQKKDQFVCRCARKHFMKKHAAEVEQDERGVYFWKSSILTLPPSGLVNPAGEPIASAVR